MLVGYPKGGTLLLAADLPADAGPDRLREAVRLARAKMAEPGVCAGGVCPGGTCPVGRR